MDKVYIIPQITLDSFKNRFVHDYTLTVEKNKINKGKVDVLNLLQEKAISVEESFFEDTGILFPKEIFITINGNQEECKAVFQYFSQNNYKGEMSNLLQEAVFLVNLKDKTFKSFADTKDPVYTIEQFGKIDKFLK